VLNQSQEDFALPAGDPGGDVEQPVTQRLGFGPVKVALVGQEHRLGKGEQVSGDQGELDPDLVDVGVPGGQAPDAGVLEPSRFLCRLLVGGVAGG